MVLVTTVARAIRSTPQGERQTATSATDVEGVVCQPALQHQVRQRQRHQAGYPHQLHEFEGEQPMMLFTEAPCTFRMPISLVRRTTA
jgi:hypothetical protein